MLDDCLRFLGSLLPLFFCFTSYLYHVLFMIALPLRWPWWLGARDSAEMKNIKDSLLSYSTSSRVYSYVRGETGQCSNKGIHAGVNITTTIKRRKKGGETHLSYASWNRKRRKRLRHSLAVLGQSLLEQQRRRQQPWQFDELLIKKKKMPQVARQPTLINFLYISQSIVTPN
jgi:hypothetical protein